jgi:hypothetical protein
VRADLLEIVLGSLENGGRQSMMECLSCCAVDALPAQAVGSDLASPSLNRVACEALASQGVFWRLTLPSILCTIAHPPNGVGAFTRCDGIKLDRAEALLTVVRAVSVGLVAEHRPSIGSVSSGMVLRRPRFAYRSLGTARI